MTLNDAQGGVPGADNLGGCAALESIVRRHALGGGLCAAICAAPPLALARWGLLDGVKVTTWPAFASSFVLRARVYRCTCTFS